MDAQAVGRVYRVGQCRPVTILRLLCRNTIEGSIRGRQAIKGRLADVLKQVAAKYDDVDGTESTDRQEFAAASRPDLSSDTVSETSALQQLLFPDSDI